MSAAEQIRELLEGGTLSPASGSRRTALVVRRGPLTLFGVDMPRAKRICAEPGCPEATDASRCLKHRRAKDKARGTREQRGYDYAHRSLRKAFIPEHKAGTLICWRCRELILPTEPFHLGHDDHDRTIYRGAEHVRCNTATNGRQ